MADGDADLVLQVAEDYHKAPISRQDMVMLEFAEKLTLQPDRVVQEDVQRLREAGFSDVEILDVVAITSYRNFIARIADGLGVELGKEYEGLAPAYRAALMVGKPA
ncbi:MAG: peroxidase [Deltaproteobacteria bacterium]|nr:peroxidase [Deltaproteobacteria bacterium]MBI3075847.1 peroxidase [Deltaproteobacteria bacterium]